MRTNVIALPKSVQRFGIILDRDDSLRMTCREAGCEAERKGWITVLNVHGDDKHAAAARLIEQDSGRRYFRLDSEDAVEWLDAHAAEHGITVTPQLHNLASATARGMVIYLFPPGQACWRRHLDREVTFVHQQGSTARIHTRPLDFNEHLNEEAYRINRERQRG